MHPVGRMVKINIARVRNNIGMMKINSHETKRS